MNGFIVLLLVLLSVVVEFVLEVHCAFIFLGRFTLFWFEHHYTRLAIKKIRWRNASSL